jgi:hypothetical protein
VLNFKTPVIYYHSIGPINTNWYRNFLTIEPSVFEDHLAYFSKEYSVITLKEYWLIQTERLSPVKNPLIITFDDGYLDNFIRAFPLLKKYGLKATIFISPEFVDQKFGVRSINDSVGFLSWDEMKLMEASGLIDIQSHTMTHTKYFVSHKIKEFHYPKSDSLYPISNLFPSEKPYYIGNKNFEKLVPNGYPFFEEASSVIARRVEINQDFTQLCVDLLKKYDFKNYNFAEAFKIIRPFYDDYQSKDKLIIKRESEKEYKDRLNYEIVECKKIIEEKLNKKVEFLCWPHGDNNELCQKIAMDAGYLMTTIGKAKGVKESNITRIPERMGADFSTWNRKQKTIFKLKAFSGKKPYAELLKTARYIRKEKH